MAPFSEYHGAFLSSLPVWASHKTPPFEWLVFKNVLIALLGSGGSGTRFDFIQPTDPTLDIPNIVAPGQWWADTANKVIYRRNDANTAWESWTGVFGPA